VRYTCKGTNTWPTISWSNVPADTKELALFIVQAGKAGTPVDWAVAGLKPTLKGISAGKLPAGAIVGRNRLKQAGYSVCPPKDRKREYVVALYSVKHRTGAKPGFSGTPLLTKLEKAPRVALLLFY
jgi:phosphatidylethanolamine-binding protein (PEBP) family uncharacterized protein